MSEGELRALQRRWESEGTDEAGAAYLRACVSRELVEEGRLRVAGLGASGAARLAAPWRCTLDWLAEWFVTELAFVRRWRESLPGASGEGVDLYELVDALCSGAVGAGYSHTLDELLKLSEASVSGGGVAVVRATLAAGAELLGRPAAADVFDRTEDLRAIVARREELEAWVGDDFGFHELEAYVDPPPPDPLQVALGQEPQPLQFLGMAVMSPVRTLFEQRRLAGQETRSLGEASEEITRELLPGVRRRMIRWALKPIVSSLDD